MSEKQAWLVTGAGPTSDPAAANRRGAQWAARLRQAAREDGAYLVPLRLFVGLGWLRAAAEKIADPGWRDGSGVATFLGGHAAAGDVAFPWYEALIAQVFLPHAAPLALLIVLGQVLAGVAITAGGFTNAALLGGLFMNLNFLLAGDPNPSAFYVVIQAALLLANAGAVLGLDAWLSRTVRTPLLVAQPHAARRRRHRRVPMLPIGAVSLVTAVYALAHVADWSPSGSVDDPAMIAAILALLGLAWATIAWLRQVAGGRRAPRRPTPTKEGHTTQGPMHRHQVAAGRECGRTGNKEHDVDKTTRTGRRQFVAQGGAAVLAAAILPGVVKRTAAAQEATPAMATPTSPEASPGPDSGETRVRFAVGDAEIIVRIADNPTSRDFVSMLPLTLEFEDFAGMEKIGYLPRQLTTEGSTGRAPANGDLIYFVPWGNLGFFYDAERRDEAYDDQVIPIGTVEAGYELLDELETGPVRVERIP